MAWRFITVTSCDVRAHQPPEPRQLWTVTGMSFWVCGWVGYVLDKSQLELVSLGWSVSCPSPRTRPDGTAHHCFKLFHPRLRSQSKNRVSLPIHPSKGVWFSQLFVDITNFTNEETKGDFFKRLFTYLRERERVHGQGRGRQRGRERENPKQVSFTLLVHNPTWGLNPWAVKSRRELKSRVGCLTDRATQHPHPASPRPPPRDV